MTDETEFVGTIVIADTETSGIDIEKSGVCQIAAVALLPGDPNLAVAPLFQTYCKPSFPMEQGALDVHGITEDKYALAPTDAQAIWVFNSMLRSLPQPVILSGYNCQRFDYPLMNNVHRKGLYESMPMLDVMTLALRQDAGKGLKLVEVFERAFPGNPLLNQAHDAMADCWMTAMVLKDWMERNEVFNGEIIAEWANTPMEMPVMPWGKYKGRLFSDVPYSYLTWAAGKWTDMHPDMELTFHKLGHL